MDNFDKYYEKTIRFLSFRPRSEKEIKDYLIKKKVDDLTTKKIIEKLKQHKFLNDEEFTKWWIEQRTRVKPRASRLIKFELKQKGIVRELVDEVFEQLSENTTDFEKALGLAQKRMARYKNEEPQKVYEKMARFLASKGFSWDTIKQVIDQVLPKEYNNT